MEMVIKSYLKVDDNETQILYGFSNLKWIQQLVVMAKFLWNLQIASLENNEWTINVGVNSGISLSIGKHGWN